MLGFAIYLQVKHVFCIFKQRIVIVGAGTIIIIFFVHLVLDSSSDLSIQIYLGSTIIQLFGSLNNV